MRLQEAHKLATARERVRLLMTAGFACDSIAAVTFVHPSPHKSCERRCGCHCAFGAWRCGAKASACCPVSPREPFPVIFTKGSSVRIFSRGFPTLLMIGNIEFRSLATLGLFATRFPANCLPILRFRWNFSRRSRWSAATGGGRPRKYLKSITVIR
jgi:hypothetical protein